jgi:hypothetical protein
MINTTAVSKQLSTTRWWVWILGINIFMILMATLFPYITHDFLRWNVINHFNLTSEMTLAAWWSGILLLFSGASADDLGSVP